MGHNHDILVAGLLIFVSVGVLLFGALLALIEALDNDRDAE